MASSPVLWLLWALLSRSGSLPVRHAAGEEDEREPENVPTASGHLKAAAARDDARLRRQLGDVEFSSRYADFLRSKAKLSSVCSFLKRMKAARNSVYGGVGGASEKVDVLLKRFMCPS